MLLLYYIININAQMPQYMQLQQPFKRSTVNTKVTFSSTHLFFGHVQESHRVSITLDICPHCVQGFVKLPLNIRQLLKNFAG